MTEWFPLLDARNITVHVMRRQVAYLDMQVFANVLISFINVLISRGSYV